MPQDVDAHCAENSTDEQCACLLASKAFVSQVEADKNRQARIISISANLSAKETEYNTNEGRLNLYDQAWEAIKFMPERRNKVVAQPAKKCDGTVNGDGLTEESREVWSGQPCQVAYESVVAAQGLSKAANWCDGDWNTGCTLKSIEPEDDPYRSKTFTFGKSTDYYSPGNYICYNDIPCIIPMPQKHVGSSAEVMGITKLARPGETRTQI